MEVIDISSEPTTNYPIEVQETHQNHQDQSQSVIQEEQSLIDEQSQENYRIWKQNSVGLYDYINTVNSIWPSLSVEFFPDVEQSKNGNKSSYRILMGNFTSGQKIDQLKIGSFTMNNTSKEEVSLTKYDSILKEFESSLSSSSSFKFKIDQNINYIGDLNNSKISPINPDLISSINNSGDVFIFDKTKHPSQPYNDEFKYEIKLSGHKKEGFGLSWNNLKSGYLLSCSIDGVTNLWDINQYSKNNTILKPLHSFKSDDSGTNDIEWNHLHDSIFTTVGEDNIINCFDQRTNGKIKSSSNKFHSKGINSISHSYQNSFLISTADSNGTLNIWDLRSLSSTPIWSIPNAHKGSISKIQFNPNRPNLLATAGFEDNFVNVWDLNKQDEEQRLVFKHGGHLLGVNDLCWNPNDDTMVSSVANDNTLQIWKPHREFLM